MAEPHRARQSLRRRVLQTRYRMAAAALSGFAAGLGHAPFGLWPIALLGFAALFPLLAGAASPRRAALTGWAFATGYFALTLHWIVEPFLVDIETHGWLAPFALVLLAGGLALFWAAAAWMASRFGGATPVAFAAVMALAELTRGHVLTGFPWALPAYIWADTPLRAATAWTGSYGLSALTLLACALPFARPARLPGTVLGAALLAGLGVLGWSETATPDDTAPLGTVRILQPNVPQTEKWNREAVPGHVARLLDLTRTGDNPGEDHDMVVWPEVALVYPLDLAGPVLAQAAEAAGGRPLLTGINRRDAGDWFNSLVVVGQGGAVTEIFDKVHLVPFGEYIPLRLGILRALAATSSNGFTAGAGVRLVETPLGRALPLICYEGIFPGHLFGTDAPADYILLITNDAWFGDYAGPRQHFDQARFRAAEHGLPLVRVANRGISAVIDPFGRAPAAARLPSDRAGALSLPVPAGTGATLYSRSGDWPALLGALFLFAAAAIVRSRKTD